MDTVTVGDFLADPDVLGDTEPLTDDGLALLSDLAPSVDPEMALRDLVEIAQIASTNEMGSN